MTMQHELPKICTKCNNKLKIIPQGYEECHGIHMSECILGCEHCNTRLLYWAYGNIDYYEENTKFKPFSPVESKLYFQAKQDLNMYERYVVTNR